VEEKGGAIVEYKRDGWTGQFEALLVMSGVKKEAKSLFGYGESATEDGKVQTLLIVSFFLLKVSKGEAPEKIRSISGGFSGLEGERNLGNRK